jgi:ABC-type sugar transport system ATPase subunit
MATVALQNISKSFDDTQVLNNINLSIEDREFIVFVGPSGCGKTTLLRIIAGLEEASEGQIIIDGEDVSSAHPVDRGISMVFQSYALYPHLSVFENIAFPLRVAKVPEAELNQRVEHAANILQLTNRLQHKPGQLSGGQRQRVAIGRSIVRNPKVFLFDEPLSNLDAALRGDMRVELASLHQDLNATMIYVTHDQVEAMTMADKIVVLNGGHVEQVGSPLDLYDRPKNRFVASFIGSPSMNLLNGEVTALKGGFATIMLAGSTLDIPASKELAVGKRISLGIRPEHLKLSDVGLRAKARVVEPTGSEIHGIFQFQDQEITAVFRERHALAPGDEVFLEIQPDKVHIFDKESGERLE